MQQQLEQSSFSAAITPAKNSTDKTCIDNMKRKKTKGRPDGRCFKAVKILKITFEKEDPHLLYSFNDGSDGRLPFILKSGKLKAKLLQNLDIDGNHRLSNETVYLDVLHSKYVMINLSHKQKGNQGKNHGS